MSEQNPTEKGKATDLSKPHEIPVLQALCPHCGRALPGMNILTMELPSPHGTMQLLLPSCPFIADPEKDGKAADGGEPCGRIIGCQFTGYGRPQIASPGAGAWI